MEFLTRQKEREDGKMSLKHIDAFYISASCRCLPVSRLSYTRSVED